MNNEKDFKEEINQGLVNFGIDKLFYGRRALFEEISDLNKAFKSESFKSFWKYPPDE